MSLHQGGVFEHAKNIRRYTKVHLLVSENGLENGELRVQSEQS